MRRAAGSVVERSAVGCVRVRRRGGPRRRLGCAHRGRWGVRCGGPGLARWAAAEACAALASRGRRRRTGWSRPWTVSLRAVAPRRWTVALCAGWARTVALCAGWARHVRACVPSAPRACPRCARGAGRRSVCPRCARLCARAVCAVCSCGLSSACACLGPCLLRVPVLCVPALCAFVLGVWCDCAALV